MPIKITKPKTVKKSSKVIKKSPTRKLPTKPKVVKKKSKNSFIKFVRNNKIPLLTAIGITNGLSYLLLRKLSNIDRITLFNQNYNQPKVFDKELKELNFAIPERVVYDPKIKSEWRCRGVTNYLESFLARHYSVFYDYSLVKIEFDGNQLNFIGNEGANEKYSIDNTSKYLPIFIDSFNRARRSGNSIQIIYFRLSTGIPGIPGHANALVIDHKTKSIDLFEPHGNVDSSIFSEHSRKIIKTFKVFKKIGYTISELGCSNTKGLQLYDTYCRKELYNSKSEGYCAAWSVFYMELKLANPDKTLKQLVKKTKEVIGTDHCRFIRAYAYNIEHV